MKIHRKIRIFALIAVTVPIVVSCCSGKKITEKEYPVTAQARLLRDHVEFMCSREKARNYRNIDALNACADYIKIAFQSAGLNVEEQAYKVSNHRVVNQEYKNIIAATPVDLTKPFTVVGAHYDCCMELPGADDNASAVAVLIETAKIIGALPREAQPKNLIFVAYTLEEPPFFGTEKMGSYVHAESLVSEGIDVKLMICLEMLGYFSDQDDSQDYPVAGMSLIYPSVGNFIGVIGNMNSRSEASLMKQYLKLYAQLPTEKIAVPFMESVTGLSDHRNYWKFDIPAIMITDTAFMRNKNYHTRGDTPDTLSYDKMARITHALAVFLQEEN